MDFSKHNSGTTSVKVHHAPGGKSNFSLAWDDAPQNNNKPSNKPPQQQVALKPNQALNVPVVAKEQPAAGKTSVKVHNPPGGKSSITFG